MKLPLWLKSFITVTLVISIFAIVGLNNIVNAFAKVDLYYFMIAILLSPLIIIFGTEKWYQIAKGSSDNLTRKDACISFLGGMSLGLLTPGRIGEFSRVLFLNGSRIKLTGIAIVDKVIDIESIFLVAVFATALISNRPLLLLTFAASLAGLIFLYFPHTFTSLFSKITRYSFVPFKNKMPLLFTGINSTSKKTITVCILYRLLMTAIDIIQFYLLITAFTPIKLTSAIISYPLIILTNILPITIGGVGVRESVSALILSRFHISPECAVSASFLLFCINTLLPGIYGAFFMSRIRFAHLET